ncbi:MAG TPA: sigma-54 dependent transcriptional regulator [Candidatus Polarisedimenticolaceae bacterium]|nr:sigma-54 dependent transcriptional regulator [Candidatus Polarisedimenticolaceae bacterium]
MLVVDDSQELREVVQRHLASEGYEVMVAAGVSEAISLLEAQQVDLVITDLKMPAVSGLDLVRHVHDNLRDTEVMMITGHPSVQSAVTAVKAGAEDYLTKPFTDEELSEAVARVLEKLRLRQAARPLAGGQVPAHSSIIGESAAVKDLLAAISKAAATMATVLITGESGTGKELVARAIHYGGARASEPFVPVNCGAIPEGLIESELFGHVKGAFTGATETRAGFFQTAERGTIFLDEISELSPSLQVKLLRVLQDKEIAMLGSTRTRRVDVRILAATNKDLPSLVAKSGFREDLFFRLHVLTIEVPPLRDRGDDVVRLARHFAARFAGERGGRALRFSDAALRSLKEYAWPGNVRELENVVQRLSIMSEEDEVDVPELPSLMRFSAPRKTVLQRTLAEVEAEHIQGVLQSVGGNKTRAAEILGVDRKTLRAKLEEKP